MSTLQERAARLAALQQEITACTACPRLREWCARVATEKVRRFRDQEYWGRPVPGFGDPAAELVIIGLAPAAHGANRTGRMFTGDDSGHWLYEALHRYGWASQPTSAHRDDGLTLHGAYITAAGRCAPPDNKPTTAELEACRPFLAQELGLLASARAVLCLGKIAFDSYLKVLQAQGHSVRGLSFAHAAFYPAPAPGLPLLAASYHPSRQNTQTGRLTREMWHGVFAELRARLHPES